MINLPHPLTFTRFIDWYHAKDRLPAEAKRTVEALLELIEWNYVWSWMPTQVMTALKSEIKERIFLACKELGLSDYYDEFPLEDVRSLLPENLRTDIESESLERIFLSCTKLSLQNFFCGDSYSYGYSYQLTDLRPLASFTQLTSLDLNGWKSENNSDSYGKLSDISVLANFTNLTELNLGQNSITDLSPLAALTELRVLDLSDNPITDLSPLSALKNLTDLQLDGTHLTEQTDFSPLLALTQLQSLDLSRNDIGDGSLKTIAQLTTLKNLNVSYNRITDISPLTTLPNLIHLNYRCAWDF
ncbi:leucine-rich repeat domain-containing protein [Microcoleus sp. ARI1-B5]|uniref:leucine-rich repeat domain-containing protein n=1 Tax=unclassified Microcoleus TaxID=2642155 RepID=UPI002FD2AEA7